MEIYNYTVSVLNKRIESLRIKFVGKNARSEAYALAAELNEIAGKKVACVMTDPKTKTYKTADAALADAKFWMEH